MNKNIFCQCHEQCFSLCINSKCNYPAIMCNQGTSCHSQCGFDHKQCKKIQWQQFQKLINHNPSKSTKQFQQIENKIDHLFIALISKIKEEHTNFKFWLTTFGLSQEAVSMITLVNEEEIEKITGKALFPVVSQLQQAATEHLIPPKIDEKQIKRIKETIEIEFVNLAQVYLKKLKDQELFQSQQQLSIRQSSQTRSTGQDNSFLKNSKAKFSKIIDQPSQLTKLFTKPIKTLKLLYRASDQNFSTKKFHQLCDNIPSTLLVVKNQHGKIFGGYTELRWSKDKKGFEADPSGQSFMYTLNPTQRYKLNLPQFAIAQGLDTGPVFGCNDLFLVDQSNVNMSRSQFPICYKNDKVKRSAETSLGFCGSKIGKFLIREWEVFQVQFQGTMTGGGSFNGSNKKIGIEEEFMKIF